MEFPDVQLELGDSIEVAADKVAMACRALGEDLYSVEPLNSLLPTSKYCHFFQMRVDGQTHFVVVIIEEWDEPTLIRIINILLEIRLDATSALGPPKIRFCSLHPIPEVLRTLFDDSRVADFECLSVPVVRFGSELNMDMALQVSTVGMFLLREVFGVTTDFWSDEGEQALAGVLGGDLRSDLFPEDGVPLNSLVALGFFYGERQRARIPHESRWVSLEEFGPWPGVVFQGASDAVGDDSENASDRVAFSPISLLLGAFQQGRPEILVGAAAELRDRCAAEFGPAVGDDRS